MSEVDMNLETLVPDMCKQLLASMMAECAEKGDDPVAMLQAFIREGQHMLKLAQKELASLQNDGRVQ
jgi:hypothetical protein